MAEVLSYAEIVKRLIREYAAVEPSLGEVEVEAVFDDGQGHYELVYAGWVGTNRVHGQVLHVDIRGGKIWVQYDGTERGIALDLLDAGVPREDVVLAFHHPSQRALTNFGVG